VTARSLQLQNTLLQTGRFLTILPATMLHFSATRPKPRILPVKLSVQPWPVGIVTLKNRTLSPVAQVFVNCAREVVKPLAAIK
jgi:DNA-binding transcriptional LysR family regulator